MRVLSWMRTYRPVACRRCRVVTARQAVPSPQATSGFVCPTLGGRPASGSGDPCSSSACRGCRRPDPRCEGGAWTTRRRCGVGRRSSGRARCRCRSIRSDGRHTLGPPPPFGKLMYEPLTVDWPSTAVAVVWKRRRLPSQGRRATQSYDRSPTLGCHLPAGASEWGSAVGGGQPYYQARLRQTILDDRAEGAALHARKPPCARSSGSHGACCIGMGQKKGGPGYRTPSR